MNSGLFKGTIGHMRYKLKIQYFGLKKLIKKLPSNPSNFISKGWKDITDDRAKIKSNSILIMNPKTKHKLRFDKGTKNAKGYKGVDHYHVYNPNATGNKDLYLDANGKPTRKGSKSSHILPKRSKK